MDKRFFLTLGCGVITTALVWFAKITPEVYAATIIATVGAYIGGEASDVRARVRGGGDA